MPKRSDLHKVLIIGSGPIIIGQACEFDYSGTQACKALREEGLEIVLVNSNPATIMTDPEFADRTYIEPVTAGVIEKILIRERQDGRPIDAVLPTIGGQTGLNTAAECAELGIWDRHGVEMIGATRKVIAKAESRTEFKQAMANIGLEVPRSGIAHSWEEALKVLEEVGLPCAIRPAYTLGGHGGGFAHHPEEFEIVAKRGLEYSRVGEILIEESVYGWKEYELEVMRDRADNVVIVCPIENFDPMGVHTGDSITVAPAQTLSDKEYQRMRDASIAIMREIGVETGGSNIQFGVHPDTGRMVVIEMNPRVSRSSALASKATGFPIAKIAAKLAIGYTLDEIPNDITKKTPACFEPTIDYCVVKIPRWTFEKFPEADETLTTQMKSVGEAMSIGRTFKEALQKGIRSMEIRRYGLGLGRNDRWWAHEQSRGDRAAEAATLADRAGGSAPLAAPRSAEAPPDWKEHAAVGWPIDEQVVLRKLRVPCQGRLYYIRYALKMGWSVERIHAATKVDPWFVENIRELVEFEERLLEVKRDAHQAAEAVREFDRTIGLMERQFTYIRGVLGRLARLEGLSSEELERLAGQGGDLDAEDRELDVLAEELAASLRRRAGDEDETAIEPVENEKVVLAEEMANLLGGVNVDLKRDLEELGRVEPFRDVLRQAKLWGYSDIQLATVWDMSEQQVRELRCRLRIEPAYKLVDTCAAEFEAYTPYYYSTHEMPPSRVGSSELRVSGGEKGGEMGSDEESGGGGLGVVRCAADDEIRVGDKQKVVILGGGPNRIGQGIEFDYCCVHAAFAVRELGFESVMVNSNPETVSTDYDTSDKLFFEPLTLEDVLNICERLNGQPLKEGPLLLKGVIVQFGGQTPLNLAEGLQAAGVPIVGTSPESIRLAEDRERFQQLLHEIGLRQPPNGVASNPDQAVEIANRIGYPVLVRPGFVLGGRGMEIVYDDRTLRRFMDEAVEYSEKPLSENPVLLDKFLELAIEVDVDCIADGEQVIVAGVMEHIEEAGVHSGDSACALPPYSLSPAVIDEIKEHTVALARRLEVRGLMNVQYAVKDNQVYVLEVNPRASRTVPFVSKATGVPWAKLAAKVMCGRTLAQLEAVEPSKLAHTSVKESVFPFAKFPGVDVILGPEMRSTGEVMGIDTQFPIAFAKSQMAAGGSLPTAGSVFISVRDSDKRAIVPIARKLARMGLNLITTDGTHRVLAEAGIDSGIISKIQTGRRPNMLDLIESGQVALIINTPTRKGRDTDEGQLRAAAVMHQIPMITTTTGARAAARAIEALRAGDWQVHALQDYHPQYATRRGVAT